MDEEKRELLDALAGMYMQYCGGKEGHACMSAGERAQALLERYGILGGTNGWGGEGAINWDNLRAV